MYCTYVHEIVHFCTHLHLPTQLELAMYHTDTEQHYIIPHIVLQGVCGYDYPESEI